VIDVTVGNVKDGLIIGWRRCPDDLQPNSIACVIWQAENRGGIPVYEPAGTLDELVATWSARWPGAELSTMTVRYRTWTIGRVGHRLAAMIVVDHRLMLVEGEIDREGASYNEDRFESFLESVRFGTPITTHLQGVTLTTPEDWILFDEGDALRIGTTEGVSPLGDVEFRVAPLEPGASTTISRAFFDESAEEFEVSGPTLAELRGSVEATLGSSWKTTIAGHRAYAWNAQEVRIGTLAILEIVEVKGTFYLLMEYLPIDGPTQPWWSDFLDSISFD
jgi:hypothetical protein